MSIATQFAGICAHNADGHKTTPLTHRIVSLETGKELASFRAISARQIQDKLSCWGGETLVRIEALDGDERPCQPRASR